MACRLTLRGERAELPLGIACGRVGKWPTSGMCRHFSLSNASGSQEGDLPLLLRRLADQIEERGIQPMEALDLTLSSEITENGPWWSATLYWSPDVDD